MEKKLIIFSVVVGLLSITNYAAANMTFPTYTETLVINQKLDDYPGNDPIGGGPGPITHTYTHTYDGSVDPLVYTDAWGTYIGSATLTIVADGVDGPGGGYDGEQDPVSLSLDGGTNWTYLGNLTMLPSYEPGGDETTVTVFNLGDYINLADLEVNSPSTTLDIKVDVEKWWEFELLSSELVIVSAIPAPGAILLGSIGVGLVGWLRRRRTL